VIIVSGGLIAKGHPVGATGIGMVGLLGKVPQEFGLRGAGIYGVRIAELPAAISVLRNLQQRLLYFASM
jgi:hypothetical protein